MKYLRLFRNENDYNQYIDGNTDDYITPNICVLLGNKRPHYTKYTFDALSGINGMLENIISGTDEPLDINILNEIQSSNQDFTDINNQLEEIIGGGEVIEMITFYVHDWNYDIYEYQAEKGMTWGEFCDSDYNICLNDENGYTFKINGHSVCIKAGLGNGPDVVYEDHRRVSLEDVIIENYNYRTV